MSAFLLDVPIRTYFEWLIFTAGLGHFLVLGASLQGPGRLGWREDLAKLKPFNTKIMWNYGFFILVLIVAFGVETLCFRDDMVSGVPSALGMAGLICGFWLLRILVDVFYFSHSDWPVGPEFVIGHALLTSLFVFLVLAYGTLLGWHWWLSL
jgi:alginate O-acetyltransferase complex protein AlgI